MPRVVFTHHVRDVEHWAGKHKERVQIFSPFATDLVDCLSSDGGSMVAVTANVHDMEGLQAMMQSPEGEKAKKDHGVVDPISIFVENR